MTCYIVLEGEMYLGVGKDRKKFVKGQVIKTDRPLASLFPNKVRVVKDTDDAIDDTETEKKKSKKKKEEKPIKTDDSSLLDGE